MYKHRIVLSGGHSTDPREDRGAISGQTVEASVVHRIVNLVYNNLVNLGVPVIKDGDTTILAETIKWAATITREEDIVVEFHLNAASNPTVKGTETFIPDNYTGLELSGAKRLSDTTSTILGTPLRGVTANQRGVKRESESARKRLGFMRIRGHNILVEVEFISNPEQMSLLNTKMPELCQAYARDLQILSRGL